MPSPDMLGAATIGMSQGLSAFTTFLPKLSDVRKADYQTNPELVGDVRYGEVAASAITIGIGAIVSSLTGSPIPAFVSVLICVVLIVVYESALKGNRPFEPSAPLVRSTDA
jgi:hypothetical protein